MFYNHDPANISESSAAIAISYFLQSSLSWMFAVALAAPLLNRNTIYKSWDKFTHKFHCNLHFFKQQWSYRSLAAADKSAIQWDSWVLTLTLKYNYIVFLNYCKSWFDHVDNSRVKNGLLFVYLCWEKLNRYW